MKNSSVKSSLQSVEYFTPALVSEPLRLSMPTSPGHVPGPVGDGEDRPAMRDQAVQHVVRVLPDGFGDDERRAGIDAAKTSMPSFCEPMKPCCSLPCRDAPGPASYPASATARASASSISRCAGQHFWLAAAAGRHWRPAGLVSS